ncbi:MAG: zinc ribbon domain-containing protein [Planctomycetes bacterium]|nr:zinc ribbon domain-containing protein [Planctomycetota bacterium]
MTWKPSSQSLACEHCGTAEPVERLPGQVLDHAFEEGADLSRGDAPPRPQADVRSLECQTCGARVSLLVRAIATRCAFCGSGQVVEEESMQRAIRPESVLPLMLSRERVARAFQKWLRGLWFRPSALKGLKGFDARGIYVPAWVFDAEAFSQWTAEAGYYYYVTETYTVRMNGRTQTRTRQVRKTRWEPAAGERRDFFDDLQVLASKGLNRELALELGPFPTQALVPYREEYLVGWEAEEYAIGLHTGWKRGQKRMRERQIERCSGDVPGDTQRNLQVDTDFAQVRWKHALLPVWTLSYRFGGKTYSVLVNGQTGKVAGQAPYSWVKITGLILILVLVGLGIFYLSQR